MPKSVIVGVSPHTVSVEASPFRLEVWGEGFQAPVKRGPAGISGSKVLLNGQPQPTEWVRADTLRVLVDPMVLGIGDAMVWVKDPDGQETEFCIPLHIRP